MKILSILILLFSPLFLFSQSDQDASPLKILVQGENLIKINRLDSAISYAEMLLSRSKLDQSSRMQALLVLGKAQIDAGDPNTAYLPLQKSLLIARGLKNNQLLVKSLLAFSAVLTEKDPPRLDSAILCLKEAKPIAEALKDTSSMARIYSNLANLFIAEEDYGEAITYSYLCDSIVKGDKFEYERGLSHCTTGRLLSIRYYGNGKADDLKAAITSFQQAVDIFEHLGKKRFEAYARIDIGNLAAFSDDYKRAERETKRGIQLGEELKDSAILLNGYYSLANNYEGEDRKKEAKLALSKMTELLEKTGTAGDIAFVTDQFSNNEVRVSVALVKNRVDLLNKQIEIAKSTQEKQMLWYISILLILILAGIVIYSYQKNKWNAQEQKLIREKLENTLKSQELEFMRARFEGEEEGRHRIARQIHDGVGGLLVSAKWNLESALEEISKKETKVAARLNENLRLQENSYKELRRVVHALERDDMPWWEDLQKFYQIFEDRNKTKILFYTYNLDKRVGGVVGEEARLIVQEAITNALKHAKASEISVQINQIEGILGIIIEDNGIGFDPQKVIKGIGLRSIEERCMKLNGTVSFETGQGAGTTIFIDIPIQKHNLLIENPLLYARTN